MFGLGVNFVAVRLAENRWRCLAEPSIFFPKGHLWFWSLLSRWGPESRNLRGEKRVMQSLFGEQFLKLSMKIDGDAWFCNYVFASLVEPWRFCPPGKPHLFSHPRSWALLRLHRGPSKPEDGPNRAGFYDLPRIPSETGGFAAVWTRAAFLETGRAPGQPLRQAITFLANG